MSDSVPEPYIHVGAAVLVLIISICGVFLPLSFANVPVLSRLLRPSVIRNFKMLGNGSIISTAFVHLCASSFEDLMAIKDFLGIAGVPYGGILASVGVFIMLAIEFSSISFRSNSKDPENNNEKSHGCCSDLLVSSLASSRRKFGLYVLEIGIAVHSIIVGATLGIKSINDFWPLFGAIMVHQFLEGFALGSIAIGVKLSFRAKFILVAMFSCTTSIGILIGSVAANSFSFRDDSFETKITRGSLSAISAGIMIYSTLVEAIIPDIQDPTFHTLSATQQFSSIVLFFSGFIIMSLIACFA